VVFEPWIDENGKSQYLNDEEDEDDDDGEDGFIPGFGVMIVIGALGIAQMLRVKKREWR